MMKKIVLLSLIISVSASYAQESLNVIDIKETERIERMLSSDEMQGRRTFSAGIEKAGAFIASEFEKTGLQKWANSGSYMQTFSMIKAKSLTQHYSIDGNEIDKKNVLLLCPTKNIRVNEKSNYDIVQVSKGMNFFREIMKSLSAKKNTVVVADTSFSKLLGRFTQMEMDLFSTQSNVIVILATDIPKKFNIEATQEIIEQPLSNVVGIIPGKSKPNEYVIFSGHYDHLGISSVNIENNDSIYNGANDDAAGTTAMIMLSKYYKALNNNERTLIFAAFTAEEVGGFGAQYFSKQFDPAAVVAMFNIEMIGTESKWGTNSAYITGFDKTDMGAILQKNLTNTKFTFYPDPYTDQNLFYRSDNATLARLGVPAHTISTSKMDSEPNYHKASDEIRTLNLENMTAIIRAIALSAKGIVDGKDTPTRVDTSMLK